MQPTIAKRLVCRFAIVFAVAATPWVAFSAEYDTILQNLYASLDQLYIFMTATCYVVGVGLLFSAFTKLKKFGHVTAFMHNTNGLVKPLMQFAIGVMLMYSPTIIDSFIYTFWGYDDIQNTNAWADQFAGSDWESYIVPLVGLIQVIGIFSFFRGWLLLNKSTNEQPPPGAVSRGLVHIVAGILGINITGTIDTINATLGIY